MTDRLKAGEEIEVVNPPFKWEELHSAFLREDTVTYEGIECIVTSLKFGAGTGTITATFKRKSWITYN